MENRFGVVENRYPTTAVFHTADFDDHSLPFRELRANDDQGYFQSRNVADLYSAQPRGRSAVPWWTSDGLGLRPQNAAIYRNKELIMRNERIEEKLNKRYTSDGLVNDSGLPITSTSNVKKTTEPQLWRKVCDPKRALLTEVNGQLIWRPANDDYDKPKWTRSTDNQPVHFVGPPLTPFAAKTPFRVYT